MNTSHSNKWKNRNVPKTYCDATIEAPDYVLPSDYKLSGLLQVLISARDSAIESLTEWSKASETFCITIDKEWPGILA
jgi:hypothetical protein